ncbi:putative efflux protein, MATE family [Lachnospiraceae bacterium RM5]|nr:putative efflux protein, MATE family [Lachnospiraceae bacterium RM5]
MKNSFFERTMKIAVPVSLQAMLQSSFSIIDQIMVGQLGEAKIAAVEIGGKPGFVFNFVTGAVAAIAGVMVSQYIGKKDEESVEKSISLNILTVSIIASLFFIICFVFSGSIGGIFTNDIRVLKEATPYIRIMSLTFLLSGVGTILAVVIRCRDKAKYPLYISFVSALVNTFLNWVLIFGHFGFSKMGVKGAAYASLIGQIINIALMILVFLKVNGKIHFSLKLDKIEKRQYIFMLLPIVTSEFLWTIGQNVNTYIYGHMGTKELAGMAMTGPVQGLLIGMLSGLAQAAGILIGKRLGEKEYDKAYKESIWLCLYGLAGSLILSIMLILLSNRYVKFFNVEKDVRSIGTMLLITFAILIPVKVENMIMGGGILRSGGKTKYIMYIDVIGTWLVGVPLGLITGVVLKMPIVWVYFILSQEEMVRLIISIVLFKKRKWINTLK